MASSPSNSQRSYRVFVSFRGTDVRNTFLSHLCSALDQAGISTYIEELKKGGQLPLQTIKAIEDSRIAIIIFSENYASSAWCLQELTKIMERREQNGLIVLPVFYRVDPHQVRTQRMSYREAMAKHESKLGEDSEKVKRWKEALFDAGLLSGWYLNDGMPEATAIKEIIKAVSKLAMYDVFLSFRGKDAREFVSRLNEALAKKEINAFMDSEKLLMGQDFPPALKQAIEQSRMYLVVFSENYAESRWCLKELVQILELKNKRKQRMLPIFYRVEPSDVRGQRQSYKNVWAKHAIDYGTHKVKKWRDALTEAANVNGIHLSDGIKDDSIPSIVEEIEKMMAEIQKS